ncbi:MAG: phytanoyl-CoA dioxygenase family protein [Caldilineaceae bacterium SB0668_bin_21]|nr:phytanoyl-CoA dioxygenase family protein [Caldilineaceae bacterium SB0668_bin_21]
MRATGQEKTSMLAELSHAQWQEYEREGYLRLGRCLTDDELAAIQQRMDEIMLGTAPVDYSRMMMQLDRIPGKTDAPGPGGKGHKGATLHYRKIQDLEFDPLFLRYMQKPLFRHICCMVYGADTPVACMRAMFMNKPAADPADGDGQAGQSVGGTHLVWHQDRWTYFDRDPLITIWTALDPATVANGCVHIAPRRHHTLINPSHVSGFMTDDQAQALVAEAETVPLEMEAGEAVLLHNYLPHSSGVNSTAIARRAFSVCYMDAATVDTHNHEYSLIFGDGALDPERL